MLMVKFPDRPPVILTGFGEKADSKKAEKKAKKPAKTKSAMRRAA
jgi:hypothetical protein